jgi:hypothetical protein
MPPAKVNRAAIQICTQYMLNLSPGNVWEEKPDNGSKRPDSSQLWVMGQHSSTAPHIGDGAPNDVPPSTQFAHQAELLLPKLFHPPQLPSR